MHGQKVSLGCRRPRALTAEAQGANMAQRGRNPPFHLQGEGQTHCGHQQLTFCQIKALVLMLTPVLCLLPWVFSFSVAFFFPWLLLYIPARGQGEEAHLNWEWICCNSQQSGASFLLLMGLCCFLRQCSGTEMLPFFSYNISLGSCLIPAMTVFVRAVFHCQAEPSSHLHPKVPSIPWHQQCFLQFYVWRVLAHHLSTII